MGEAGTLGEAATITGQISASDVRRDLGDPLGHSLQRVFMLRP